MSPKTMMTTPPSLLSILIGAIVAILLSNPAVALPFAENEYDPSVPTHRNLATGDDLVVEMQQLHTALEQVQNLLLNAEIPAEDEIMSKSAKLIRRVRSLVYATNHELGRPESRRQTELVERRMVRVRQREHLRKVRRAALRGDIDTVRVQDIAEEEEALLMELEGRELGRRLVEPEEDVVVRNMYEETITFPECQERLLEDCIEILNKELLTLHMEAEMIIHKKRDQHQDGYNKVVIITDLACGKVTGKLNDGIVEYPYMWNDALLGPKTLGVNGKWDCAKHTPEDCCDLIKSGAPNPDTKGNYLQCHIFVPFGGVGNKNRSDRVFINLSPDGRVHEPPIIH